MRGADGGSGAAAPERVSALPDGDRAELQLLLRLRYRVRNDLGLPEDRYDLLLDGLGGADPEPADARLTATDGQRVGRCVQVHGHRVALGDIAGEQRPGQLVANG